MSLDNGFEGYQEDKVIIEEKIIEKEVIVYKKKTKCSLFLYSLIILNIILLGFNLCT